jgi:hypothetical protein
MKRNDPRTRPPPRVLDWTNLALACTGGTYRHHQDPSRQFTTALNTSCGQAKRDADLPPGCDPRSFPLVAALIEVGIDGTLAVKAQSGTAASIAPTDLEKALALVNLNCERLRKTRQDIGDDVRSWFVLMLEELVSSRLSASQRQLLVDLLVDRRLHPDERGTLPRFWSAERCALGAPAETWIGTNQGAFT